MHGVQLSARLDPELLDEDLARVAVRSQRVGLPAATVEREHQLRVQPLAQRVLHHERLQLARKACVMAERELRLHAQLDRSEAQLLQADDRPSRKRRVAEVRQRWAAPQRQRLAQAFGRGRGVSPGERPVAGLDSPAVGGYTAYLQPLPDHTTYVGLGEVDVRYNLSFAATQAQLDARV